MKWITPMTDCCDDITQDENSRWLIKRAKGAIRSACLYDDGVLMSCFKKLSSAKQVAELIEEG